ncbi:MAG: type II toxin-antitoxin system VapC family toxin [Euryarchaeota archaeon]|nr:type II toxin-antitoxin system VapC family toxin [Euryarchaeota archaeon]MDE1835291.1 type II toxin-antitoxin system VapC family toxin [Euryarchaeota archaeon]MDE1881068.1 type II toxin-antitoxin system VapC family toxin [Euryarchaeota archaeon]MDE2043587.1 type II toxin-antitoxin system VapC family toxin [Thermoplasmata archaeon]
MKCLDTPLLEDLLMGRPSSRRWMGALKGSAELATTEVNLFELTLVALRGPRRTWTPRLRSLEEVRRALTLLPLDAEASRRAAGILQRGRGAAGGLLPLVVGVCLAHGVGELYTTRQRKVPRNVAPLRIVHVGHSNPVSPTKRARTADL